MPKSPKWNHAPGFSAAVYLKSVIDTRWLH